MGRFWYQEWKGKCRNNWMGFRVSRWRRSVRDGKEIVPTKFDQDGPKQNAWREYLKWEKNKSGVYAWNI